VQRIALWIVIVSVSISAVLGILALLAGDFGETQWKILGTTSSVTGASVLAMASATAWGRRDIQWLAPLGAAAGTAGFAIVIGGIWVEPSGSDVWWQSASSLIVVASAASYAALAARATLAGALRWALWTAYASDLLLALTIIAVIWTESDNDAVARWIGIVAIVLASSTVLLPVFHRMSSERASEPAGPDAPPGVRFCPRCGARITAAAGEDGPHQCASCGARFQIEFAHGA
jgi:hypothetical protein